MAFQKWHSARNKKTTNKVEVKEENKVEEKAVDTVEEKNPSVIEEADPIIPPMGKSETPVFMGTVWGSSIKKPVRSIQFEAQVAPVPMYRLPKDIQQYLINKWFGTNVWKRPKEWLEKHGADMEMIEKLKKFLSQM